MFETQLLIFIHKERISILYLQIGDMFDPAAAAVAL